jgi:2-polyprenyl-6-methoxyphenol hydroxylase-like FAD-dependent oxidoreductase
MTLALTLARLGVQAMVVERNPDTTQHPKMDITNVRSMELFRRLGLAQSLRMVAVPERHCFDVAWVTTMAGHELHRFRYPSVIEKRAEIARHNDGSQPLEPAMRVSQVLIEPALKRAVEAEALVLSRFGTAFEDCKQDADGVTALCARQQLGAPRQYAAPILPDATVVRAACGAASASSLRARPASRSVIWYISARRHATYCNAGA